MYIYTDYYNIASSSGDSTNFLVSIIAGSLINLVLSSLVSIFMLIVLYKLFEQNDIPGWKIFIPVYNVWLLFSIGDVKGWWSLVPFANGIFLYIVLYKIAIKYGKSQGFAVLSIFFPVICLPMMVFGHKKNINENNSYQKNNVFCIKCGQRKNGNELFCTKCGNKF